MADSSTSEDDCPIGDHTSPAVLRTKAFREYLDMLSKDDLVRRLRQAIEYMADNLKLDITLLLYYISWTVEEAVEDPVIKYARTALMNSEELPTILKNWHQPPRKHNGGITTKGGRLALQNLAQDVVSQKINAEMRLLAPRMRLPPSEVSDETLLSITVEDLFKTVKTAAPTMWSLCRSASYTPQQEKQNSKKNPDLSVAMMISIASYNRSHHSCKLQKFFGIYFKACGTSAKGLDTLHALGITVSQKTIYGIIDGISKSAHRALRIDILTYPFGGLHDNLNTQQRVYEQRLSNQSHFDSGTAATIFVIKDPAAIPPSNRDYHAQYQIGSQNPIQILDILKLEYLAAPRLETQAVYQILSVLMHAAPFDFDTYEHHEHIIFKRPPSVFQLPIGPHTATIQYLLDTIHVDESSYEGNEACLIEFFRQLGKDALGERIKLGTEQLIVWLGDQLTTSRIRGIKRLHSQDLNAHERYEYLLEHAGWFHTQITEGHSLHSQYYGTSAGVGLKHDFDLLKRKGLGSPTTKGNFHQNLNGTLKEISAARFRDLWCVVGEVECLSELRDKTPDQLKEIAEKIYATRASTEAVHKQRMHPRQKQDDVLTQAIQFNRDILNFLDFDDAMKTGDVGRMRDMLPRLLFRFVGGGNSNYVTECLEIMQGLEREWPEDLKVFIMRYCWLANTTGHANKFLPYDMLQEHNIRDIKYTFASMGPYATWDYIKKISASIPTQRRIKDHVEDQINHFFRGKAHTSPDQEEDIALLQRSYCMSAIHQYNPRRQLNSADKVEDYMAKGADLDLLRRSVSNWAKKRMVESSNEEDWASDGDSETAAMIIE